jgi:hypothetical protein
MSIVPFTAVFAACDPRTPNCRLDDEPLAVRAEPVLKAQFGREIQIMLGAPGRMNATKARLQDFGCLQTVKQVVDGYLYCPAVLTQSPSQRRQRQVKGDMREQQGSLALVNDL